MSLPQAVVIEDDPAQAQIFAQALQDAGYAVTHLADGDQALAYLREHRPHLVLLDLHLPGTAGDTILRAIRQDERLAATRVMLATADPRMAETLRSDSDLVLLKPVSFIQLRDLARRMLPQT